MIGGMGDEGEKMRDRKLGGSRSAEAKNKQSASMLRKWGDDQYRGNLK